MSYTSFFNPSKLRWSSDNYWRNGQQRTLLDNNATDPYDFNSSLSISQGERRKAFIDGYGRLFHSGDRSRINIRANAYNQQLKFTTEWKTNITNLSIRLRSRIDFPDPEANKFGGYVAVISSNEVKWYKQNYAGNYTSLNPTTTTIDPAIVVGARIRIDFYVFSINNNTQTELRLKLSRNTETEGLTEIGSSIDSSPASHVLDSKLYRHDSFAHIKLNGTAKDVKYTDVLLFDLGDEYLYGDYNKGTIMKQLELKYEINETITKTGTKMFDIEELI